MSILNLPPEEKPTPLPPKQNQFRVIPTHTEKAYREVARNVEVAKLNLANNILELIVKETPKMDILDWILTVQEEEEKQIVSVMIEDGKGQIASMLRLCGAGLLYHECIFSKEEPGKEYGIDAEAEVLKHEVHLGFQSVEKVRQTPSI